VLALYVLTGRTQGLAEASKFKHGAREVDHELMREHPGDPGSPLTEILLSAEARPAGDRLARATGCP